MSDDNYTDDELAAKLDDPKIRMEALNHGMRILLTLIAGPKQWETISPLAVDLEKAREAAKVMRSRMDRYADKTWIESQKALADAVLAGLWKEFESWCAANGREDLLVNSVDLINAALPADERIQVK